MVAQTWVALVIIQVIQDNMKEKTNQELHKEVMERIAQKKRGAHLKFQGIKSVAKSKALSSRIDSKNSLRAAVSRREKAWSTINKKNFDKYESKLKKGGPVYD